MKDAIDALPLSTGQAKKTTKRREKETKRHERTTRSPTGSVSSVMRAGNRWNKAKRYVLWTGRRRRIDATPSGRSFFASLGRKSTDLATPEHLKKNGIHWPVDEQDSIEYAVSG